MRNARLASITVLAVIFFTNTTAIADDYSKALAKSYGQGLTKWISEDERVQQIPCEDSRAVTTSDDTSPLSPCARLTTPQTQSEVGLYRFVYDIRALEHGSHGYMVNWSELESGARIYLEEDPPREVLSSISTDFARDFSDWSEARKYSAGFTRQFQGATATNAEGKRCLVLTGKRGKGSTLTVLTCADELPDKTALKRFLKTLK